HVGGFGCDDEFLRLESVSDQRHSETEAIGTSPVADAALRLRFEVGLQDCLIFGRQRSLLTLPPRLARVERGMARESPHTPEDPGPLTAQVGILGLFSRCGGGDRSSKRRDQRYRSQCDVANRPSIQHDLLRWCKGRCGTSKRADTKIGAVL